MKGTTCALFLTLCGLGWVLGKGLGEGTLPGFLEKFDLNKDHRIDEEERQAIRDLRIEMRRKNQESVDLDNDGTISKKELDTARDSLLVKIQRRREEKFLSIAGVDALISPAEYQGIPGIEFLSDSAFQEVWSHLDLDEDDFVSFEEFTNVLRNHQSDR